MNARVSRLIPFVPSGADFARSLAFFEALGFAKLWEDGGIAGLRSGEAEFLLQSIDVPEWQRNQMIVLEVPSLDDYWAEVEAMDLPAAFPGVSFRVPTDFPWGREVHFIDPAGVCWHVRQAEG